MRSKTRTIRELKSFKYFHHIFNNANDSSYDIYGYYIDMRFVNLVLVRTFFRYAFPYDYKEKFNEMRGFPIIFLHQEHDKRSGNVYHRFINGFTIFGIMEQIIKERKEDEKKMDDFTRHQQMLHAMYVRNYDELSRSAELINFPIIDHLNLIR